MTEVRLIDANALKKYLEQESYTYPNDEEFGCGFNECLLQVFLAIDNAPTIEPFERIGAICDENCGHRAYGKWVKSKDGYMRCDQCGSRGSAIKARFCHHCGADMRGDKNDSN